jgi:signal transduction histidine kinase
MAGFRTKARAVDLLGKGQIADLPTAITELWRNGYDAYADKVELAIYKPGYEDITSPLLIISDDGKGMSRKDIYEKWLVLGTDSKSRNETDVKSPDTLWKEPRIKAGEKGIGRLSVAFIGSPMLMLTKKMGSPLQALYFDWRILENYNLFLEDVKLPVIDILPDRNFKEYFESLKSDFLRNFEIENDDDGNLIWEERQEVLKEIIFTDTKNAIFYDSLVEKQIIPFYGEKSHGTQFILFNPEEQLINIISSTNDTDGEEARFIRSSLLAFTNTFSKKKLLLEYSISIYSEIGKREFLTSGGQFFEIEDFNKCDIVIAGKLDGKGNFNGKIRIYDSIIDYNEKINQRKFYKKTDFGECIIKLGYLMGNESESLLKGNNFDILKKKLINYGGIYIYRDGFRVLPYGRPDKDFLGLEERRSKSAGYYFFSYRRLFGFIGLTRDNNPELKDKAGREGLISNIQYRAFVADLEGLFLSLAVDFFRDSNQKSTFHDKKKSLSDQADALKADKSRVTNEKKSFTRGLKEYPIKLEKYKEEYTRLVRELDQKVNEAEIIYSDIVKLTERIKQMDLEYKHLMPEIPKHYKPTELQLERLYNYEQEVIRFTETIKTESSDLFNEVNLALEVHELQKEFENNYNLFKTKLETEIYNHKTILNSKLNEIRDEYSKRSNQVLRDLESKMNHLKNSISSKSEVINSIAELEEEYFRSDKKFEETIIPAVNHINRVSFDIDEELLKGAYRSAYEEMKEQWELTNEMAQLGIAVEIIDHEFNVLYSAMNNSITELNPKIEKYPELTSNFKYFINAFHQLEDKYELLSPLYRAAGIVPKEIHGKEIINYLKKFFQNSFSTEGIIITPTEKFKICSLVIKEPVLFAVLINVVNNAIYWMKSVDHREIKLDYFQKSNEILIMNSGEPIKEFQLTKIFELFYSKRGGRGLGLFLARQSLQKSYMDIYTTNDPKYNQLGGACFVIAINPKN